VTMGRFFWPTAGRARAYDELQEVIKAGPYGFAQHAKRGNGSCERSAIELQFTRPFAESCSTPALAALAE